MKKHSHSTTFSAINVFVFLLLTLSCFSQDRIDSLRNSLEKETIDSVKIKILQKISYEYKGKNWRKAVNFATEAIKIADKNEYTLTLAKLRIERGLYLYYLSKLDSAETDFNAALILLNSIGNKIGIADCYNDLGAIYSDRGDCEVAKEKFNQAINIWTKIGKEKKIIKAINNIAICYSSQGELSIADSIIDVALRKSKKIKYKDGLKMCYSNKFISYARRSIPDTALMYSDSLLSIIDTTRDKITLGNLYLNRGHLFLIDENYEKAIEEYLKSGEIFNKVGNMGRYASVNFSIGNIFSDLGQFKKAEEYIKKALVIYEEKGFKDEMANAYYTLGKIIQNTDVENYEKQIEYYQLADQLYKETKNLEGQARILQILGISYRKMGNFEQSLKYLLDANKIIKDKSYKRLLFGNFVSLGRTYAELGQYAKSIENFDNAIRLGKKMNKSIYEVYEYKADALVKKGDYKNAYSSFKTAYSLRDSLYNVDKVEEINEIEAKYQSKIKQDSINLLKSSEQIAKQELAINESKSRILGLGLFVLLGLTGFLFYVSSSRKKRNKLLAEKNEKITLLSRENSHRIKNNLALLSSIMKMQIRRLDNPESKEVIKESENRVRALSILEKELQSDANNRTINLPSYLEKIIQNIRAFYFSTDKNVEIDFDVQNIELDADAAMRLGLILNELITNSIKHAFKNQDAPKISIKIDKNTQGALNLHFKDNGIGLSEELDMEKINSMGMKLIKSMTEQLGGKLKIENDSGAVFLFSFGHLLKTA